MLLTFLLACTSDKDDTETDTDHVPTTDTTETGTTPGTSGETGDTHSTPGACDPDPSLTVDLSVSAGPAWSLAQLTVDASVAAKVAVTCVSTTDPAERHLLESAGQATHHELRLLGLLQDTTYTCEAVATCPESAVSSSVQHTTGHEAGALPELQVTRDPTLEMTGAYTLAPWLVDGCHQWTSPVWTVLWDPEGHPRWAWAMAAGVYVDFEAQYDRTTGLIEWGGGESDNGAFNSLDPWDGRVYAASLPMWDENLFSHDGTRVDDHRVLTLQTIQNHNAANTKTWDGFGIRLVDQSASDAVLFQFDSQRYVDAAILEPNPILSDPYHANSVQWFDDPSGPVLYVSLCFAQEYLAIDGDDGSLQWQLGRGRGWTVLDESGRHMPESELPQCQHGTERLDPTHFLFYDNGQLRLESRVEEWRIDADNKTVQREWMWTEPGWFQPFVGDADDLGNGRVLLIQADNGCHVPRNVQIVEVDRASGKVVHRMTFPSDVHGAYRVQRVDGCDLFANTRYCSTLASRWAELEPLFAP